VPFGVPTTCRWFFASRNRTAHNLGILRAPFERSRLDLPNELSFAPFQPIFEEIRASKGRSTRQGKRGRIQPRKTLGRARASLLLHGPNQVGVHRSKPLKTECSTTSIGRATSGEVLPRLHGSHSDTPSLPMKKKWRWGVPPPLGLIDVMATKRWIRSKPLHLHPGRVHASIGYEWGMDTKG